MAGPHRQGASAGGTLRPDTNRHLSPDELESNINNLPVTERRLRCVPHEGADRRAVSRQ